MPRSRRLARRGISNSTEYALLFAAIIVGTLLIVGLYIHAGQSASKTGYPIYKGGEIIFDPGTGAVTVQVTVKNIGDGNVTITGGYVTDGRGMAIELTPSAVKGNGVLTAEGVVVLPHGSAYITLTGSDSNAVFKLNNQYKVTLSLFGGQPIGGPADCISVASSSTSSSGTTQSS